MLIRPIEAGDLPAITSIYADAVRLGTASFELDAPDEGELARRFAALASGGHPALAAIGTDGVLAGYAYAGPYRPRPAYAATVENSVYVHGSRQGAGVGRRLLGALVEASAAAGFRQMIAVIGDSANTPSIRLHAAAGFVPVGTLRNVGWKHGRWLDTVLMQRELGNGAAIPAGRDRAE